MGFSPSFRSGREVSPLTGQGSKTPYPLKDRRSRKNGGGCMFEGEGHSLFLQNERARNSGGRSIIQLLTIAWSTIMEGGWVYADTKLTPLWCAHHPWKHHFVFSFSYKVCILIKTIRRFSYPSISLAHKPPSLPLPLTLR